MSDGRVIPGLTRWTEMTDVDRSYAFVLRVFYDSKDVSAGRLHGANRLVIGQPHLVIGNESVPIQLAQCWFRGQTISNAKI